MVTTWIVFVSSVISKFCVHVLLHVRVYAEIDSAENNSLCLYFQERFSFVLCRFKVFKLVACDY